LIYLFSDRPGALRQGADFMRQKHAALHPAVPAFYLDAQDRPLHECLGNLGPDSDFQHVDCRLAQGEAAIVIGHGGAEPRLYDEAQRDVTQAALRLMAKIAADNRDRRYTFFLAACGGGVRQPAQQTSLLTTLVKGTPTMAGQLLCNIIACYGYTASAGLVHLSSGLPVDRQGTHIYGTLEDERGVEQHCGYDCRITTRLHRLSNGTYVTIYFSPALYPLAAVLNWANRGFRPDMAQAFPLLFATVQPTR
jgi:hypothetical protein